MKKVIIFVMALALTVGVNAQDLKYGVKAGLNLSSTTEATGEFEGEELYKTKSSDMLAGFFVAAHLNYSFSELFGIQPELEFSMQGSKEGESTMRLNYINIPVMLDIKPFENFSIMVGPKIGFNVFKKMKDGDNSISGSKVTEVLKESGQKLNALSLAAAIGLQYTFMEHFTVSARYNFGLTKTVGVHADAKDYSISGGQQNVIQIGVGYQF